MTFHQYLPLPFKNFIQFHFVGPKIEAVGPVPLSRYSQGGEDIIILQILRNYDLMKRKGFFVDVGAFHPYTDSNTFILYTRGWRGINIDARPNSMIAFNKYRPEDINLEIGISKLNSVLDFYYFDDNSTMNSFSKEYLENIGMMKNVNQVLQVKTSTLKDVLQNQTIPTEGIDYLNIDAEGLDLEVINSNDFERFRPKVISVEVSAINTIEDVCSSETYKELQRLGYICVAKNFILKSVATLFFVDKALNT
jgi:FkbM family methyltransferase